MRTGHRLARSVASATAIATVVTLGFGGCSTSKTPESKTPESTSGGNGTGVTTPDDAGRTGLIDVATCKNNDGAAEATGTLTNNTAEPISKRLVVEFRDTATGEPLDLTITDIDDLPAGETVTWSAGPKQIASDVAVTCVPSLEDPPPGG